MNERLYSRGLAVLVTLAVLLTGVMAVLAQGGGTTEVLGGDEASLRALLARIAESYGPDGDYSEVEVGQLTNRLPFSLPLPDETTVLGSVSDLRDGAPYHIQVIAHSGLAPEDVAAFYASALTDAPWRNMRDLTGNAPGGFTVQQVDWANFCYGDEAMLQISARALEDAGTDIRYHIQVSPLPDLCTGTYAGEMMASQAFSMLPSLFPPEGVTQINSSAGSGGANGQPVVYSAAILETDLDLDALSASYAAQLEEAGWALLGREIGTRLSWSGWRLTDEQGNPWEATLTITARAVEANQVQIQLNLNRLPAS
jgi:hypothetical protein